MAKEMMRAMTSFAIAAPKGGYPRRINEGDIIPLDDIPKTALGLFRPYEDYLEVVEKATSAPGQVRVTKPKPAAKKQPARAAATPDPAPEPEPEPDPEPVADSEETPDGESDS